MHFVRHARALCALALLAASAPAAAQRTGYDLERLTLDPSAIGSLVLGVGETLPAGGFRLSLAGHYEYRPVVLTKDGFVRGYGVGAGSSRDGDIVSQRVTGHLGIGLAITDRVELGVRLPYVGWQTGDTLAGFPKLRSPTLASPSLMLRYGALSERRGAPVSVAVAAEAHFPLARTIDVTGNPGTIVVPRIEVGKRLGKFLVGADLGANLRVHATDLTKGERLRHEVLAGVVLATTGAPFRWEVSARGAFNFNGLNQSAELLAGARYALGIAEVFALAGPGFLEAPGTPTFRGVLGLAIPAGAPAPKPVAAAAPPPPVDPCAPGQPHRPEQCPALDDDGDGVPNGQDRCPLEKGIAENHGCPPVDSDGDGVPDHLDKCPKVKGEEKYQGCPPPDRDGDGVPDEQDKCPDQPGVPEEQGCPPKRAEIKVDESGVGKIDIKEKVYFDTGKSTIQPRSFPLLDDVAKLLVANPKVGPITVEGHTDDRGPAELNRKLSQDRAEAVKAYLVEKGVDAGRLAAKGFGPDRPAEPNTTAKGRDANRRVEFRIGEVQK